MKPIIGVGKQFFLREKEEYDLVHSIHHQYLLGMLLKLSSFLHFKDNGRHIYAV